MKHHGSAGPRPTSSRSESLSFAQPKAPQPISGLWVTVAKTKKLRCPMYVLGKYRKVAGKKNINPNEG